MVLFIRHMKGNLGEGNNNNKEYMFKKTKDKCISLYKKTGILTSCQEITYGVIYQIKMVQLESNAMNNVYMARFPNHSLIDLA